MFNVCWHCGLFRADKEIDPTGPFAICPECGHRHPFKQLPLFIVCGASGAGKSAVYQKLTGTFRETILLEADILWRDEFNSPEENYRDFFETWLRLGLNIGQAGHPVTLFCAGGIPENIESCVERKYFTQVHYLALCCGEEELADRLRRRPAWREAGGSRFIQDQVAFNRWIVEKGQHAKPPILVIDTTRANLTETSGQVAAWINARLSEEELTRSKRGG